MDGSEYIEIDGFDSEGNFWKNLKLTEKFDGLFEEINVKPASRWSYNNKISWKIFHLKWPENVRS